MMIDTALRQLAEAFSACSDSPRLDAEVLLCHVLAQPRSYLYTWPERELQAHQQQTLLSLAARRQAGEPVAYLTEQREFWSLTLQVGPATLIPRPETELLVEAALMRIPADAAHEIADLGTGSGAIALAIASERPLCRITAVERCPKALAIAKQNAARLGLDNICCVAGNWYEPLTGQRFSLILSNPPYIRDDDPHLEQGDVRHEPRTALASGKDGLDDIREIISHAPDYLEPHGWLMLEHGYDQAESVCALLRDAGFTHVMSLPDLQGHGRVAIGQRGPILPFEAPEE